MKGNVACVVRSTFVPVLGNKRVISAVYTSSVLSTYFHLTLCFNYLCCRGKKVGCPAVIVAGSSKDGAKLVIRKMNEVHNHEVDLVGWMICDQMS